MREMARGAGHTGSLIRRMEMEADRGGVDSVYQLSVSKTEEDRQLFGKALPQNG
jgi:hypothetical protein